MPHRFDDQFYFCMDNSLNLVSIYIWESAEITNPFKGP